MNEPIIHISHRVEEIRLGPGEVVTVWLNGAQVELRVLEDGKREIFFTNESIQTHTFDAWYSGDD